MTYEIARGASVSAEPLHPSAAQMEFFQHMQPGESLVAKATPSCPQPGDPKLADVSNQELYKRINNTNSEETLLQGVEAYRELIRRQDNQLRGVDPKQM